MAACDEGCGERVAANGSGFRVNCNKRESTCSCVHTCRSATPPKIPNGMAARTLLARAWEAPMYCPLPCTWGREQPCPRPILAAPRRTGRHGHANRRRGGSTQRVPRRTTALHPRALKVTTTLHPRALKATTTLHPRALQAKRRREGWGGKRKGGSCRPRHPPTTTRVPHGAARHSGSPRQRCSGSHSGRPGSPRAHLSRAPSASARLLRTIVPTPHLTEMKCMRKKKPTTAPPHWAAKKGTSPDCSHHHSPPSTPPPSHHADRRPRVRPPTGTASKAVRTAVRSKTKRGGGGGTSGGCSGAANGGAAEDAVAASAAAADTGAATVAAGAADGLAEAADARGWALPPATPATGRTAPRGEAEGAPARRPTPWPPPAGAGGVPAAG